MEDRYHDIDAAQTGTCKWLSPHKIYREWVKRNRGLLWIKGKPGSGKSTLLRHALDNAKKRCSIEEKPLILSFFFHGRGTELQRTPPGFYRSLLHQLRMIPDAVSDVVNTFKEKCETFGEVGKTWQWHPKQLRELFESSILEAIKLRPIYLFVDALDECGEADATMLARRFKDLLESLQSTAYKPFHICFTCRPYPILTSDNVFEICVERGNRADISNFVQHQLSDIGPTIRELITERANGVFLWASLIVKRITSLNLKAAKLEEMKAAILPVPQELDALYLELTKEMGLDSLRLIQCVCVAMEPLSIAALRWAMVIKTKPPYSSLQECRDSPHYQPDGESMKRRIQTLSHGLVGVTSNKKVQFIHQTVKDFFVEKGLLKLNRPNRVPLGTSESDYAVGMAHDEMSKICVRYLVMEEKARVNLRAYAGSLKGYALEMWAAHVQQSEQRGISQDDLLDCFVWPLQTLRRLRIRLDDAYDGWSRVKVYKGICLSHVASVYGLTGLLQTMLKMTSRTKSMINEKDMYGRTPLMLAAENDHKATARLLLEHGADINMKDEEGWTPLIHATESGHEGIVQLLLEHGAACDINVKDRRGRTPLSIAAGKRNKSTLQLLLKYGGDRNA
ncbi:Het-eN, partial [Metarhizium majus ARSEF 297]